MHLENKKKMRILLLMLFISIGSGISYAQTTPPANPKEDKEIKDQEIESIIEGTESESGDLENNTFLEEQQSKNGRRLNINKASFNDLLELGILSDIQIQSILNYIKSYGEMKSLYELQGVYGLDRETLESLIPLVETGLFVDNKTKTLKEQLVDGKHQIFIRYNQILEKAAGYQTPETPTSSHYLGDRSRLYLRYRYQFGTLLSYGITIEKDPGEQLFNKKNTAGIDYFSGHLFFRDRGPFKAVALGDYQVNMGQGLICFQGFGLGKSPAVLKVKRWGRTILPHTSANEALFFRGAATTIELSKQFEITAFFSYRGRDANVVTLDSLEIDENLDEEISSIGESGYHRTNSELEDRNSIKQLTAGGSLKWRGKKATIGLNTIYNKLDKALEPNTDLYNQFQVSGKTLINASIDYSYLFNKVHFFGEEAISQNGGFALLNGVLVKPTGGFDFAVVHRYYSKNYQQLFANAFAESSTPVNENGLYVGFSFSPIKFVKIESYFDFFKFPWLRFLTDAPTSGMETLTQISYSPTRKFSCYARVKYETKGRNAPDDDVAIDYPVNTKKTTFRFHMAYNLNEQWSLKSRVELNYFNNGFEPKTKGYLAYQDLTWMAKNKDWTLTGRFGLFQTDEYDNRIYAYENDVLYSFSVPAYYGTGMRYYMMVKYRATRWMDIWVRYGQFYYPNQTVISSGLDEIEGNRKSEIKAQIRLKF